MITIQELLFNRGLDKNAKIKLVRHKDGRQDLYNLYKTEKDKFLRLFAEFENYKIFSLSKFTVKRCF